MATSQRASGSARDRLGKLFQRNGYVRVPDAKRRQELRANYKKGWEVRLVLKSDEETEEASRLLRRVGFTPGKRFVKVRQQVLPVYGKAAVEYFLALRRDDG